MKVKGLFNQTSTFLRVGAVFSFANSHLETHVKTSDLTCVTCKEVRADQPRGPEEVFRGHCFVPK